MSKRYALTAMNIKRAKWADQAVAVFAKATGMEWEDDQTRLTDLLCDLMHWAKQREGAKDCPVSFSKALASARGHFKPERKGDDL